MVDARPPRRLEGFFPDHRSPIQRDAPRVWDGTLPATLPTVALDTGERECAAGWNYSADIWTAVMLCGLWPTGRPNLIVRVRASGDAIERDTKRRASSLDLLRLATDEEISEVLAKPFGAHGAVMAREQLAWRRALARPQHDPGEVEAQLVLALSARGLAWSLKEYRAARAARAAWDARAALSIYFARLALNVAGEPDQFTVGLRNAYAHGLELAIPTGPATLGWAMEETNL